MFSFFAMPHSNIFRTAYIFYVNKVPNCEEKHNPYHNITFTPNQDTLIEYSVSIVILKSKKILSDAFFNFIFGFKFLNYGKGIIYAL